MSAILDLLHNSNLLLLFDKQIAENIKILLSFCESVSESVCLSVSEIRVYWAAYAAKNLSVVI